MLKVFQHCQNLVFCNVALYIHCVIYTHYYGLESVFLHYHGLCGSNKLLYKRCSKSMGRSGVTCGREQEYKKKIEKSALEIFLSMRYINLHFTHLLTYKIIIQDGGGRHLRFLHKKQ